MYDAVDVSLLKVASLVTKVECDVLTIMNTLYPTLTNS